MTATDKTATEYTGYTEYQVPVLARLIPSPDRAAILGDLFEEAEFRGLTGLRRHVWIATECGAIAAGLSAERARGWFVMPPMREVFAGFAVDGRGVLRGSHPLAAMFRALIFCGSIATLVLGVEVLVATFLSAAGL